MKWVKIVKYIEMTGETRDSVKLKRLGSRNKLNPKPPVWAEGVHWKTGPDNRVWINTEAVDNWMDRA